MEKPQPSTGQPLDPKLLKRTSLATWTRSSLVFPFTHRIISSVLLRSHPVRLAMIWVQRTG